MTFRKTIESIQQPHTRILLAISLIWVFPTLACGSFAPRPTPTPTTAALRADLPAEGILATSETTAPDGDQAAIATPVAENAAPTQTATPVATATFTATPIPGSILVAGQPARVVAPFGLNMRASPSAGAALIIQLGLNQRIDVLDGPQTADGYTWWQVDDGLGNVGWVAESDGETEWLNPRVGGVQPVNRAPRVGDRVIVSTEDGQQLTVRGLPGTDGPLVTRINPNSEFTVLAGPQIADGFNWYQVRSDDGTIEGWVADGDEDARWLSPLE